MRNYTAMDYFLDNVRHLLSAREMTQRELAKRAGIPAPNLSRILNGTENVSLERADRIAGAFGISLSDLLDENLKKVVLSS